MRAPRFYSNALISAELHINQWISIISQIYGGFHGSNSVSAVIDSAFFDDTYMAAYIRHASGWKLVVPTTTSKDQQPVASGHTLTRTNTPTPIYGVYYHEYTVPSGVDPGALYKVTVEVDDDDEPCSVYPPYETLDSGDFPTLSSFTSGSISRSFHVWNNVSDGIDILLDTIALNSKGFTSVSDTIKYDKEVTHYIGSTVHTESNFLYNFDIKLPSHNNNLSDTKCVHTYWDSDCEGLDPCWHSKPQVEPCWTSANAWSTFSMDLQVEIPGGSWESLARYHCLILAHQIDTPRETVEVIDVGLVAKGDMIEGYEVDSVDAGDNEITFTTPMGTRQQYKRIKTSHTNSTEKVCEFADEYHHVEFQGNVVLPTITEGDTYNIRIKTYDNEHKGTSHADVRIGYLGEVQGSTTMSPYWSGMKRWSCEDAIDGSPGKLLSDIISNVEYLAEFDSVNYSSPKLRDPKNYNHRGMVFQRKKRFLWFYCEETASYDEFEPTISYYNYIKAEWVKDSLPTEINTWHVIDLDSLEGLYSGGFYTLGDLSYALESGDNA